MQIVWSFSMENQMIYSGIEDMDIKSGGREMATVVYSNEEDGMCSFVIEAFKRGRGCPFFRFSVF